MGKTISAGEDSLRLKLCDFLKFKIKTHLINTILKYMDMKLNFYLISRSYNIKLIKKNKYNMYNTIITNIIIKFDCYCQ